MTNDTPDDDFGALLEESFRKERRRFAVGDRVTATVVQVGQERLILDLGDGQDGLMELSELGEAADRPAVSPGDTIEAYVLRFENRVAELGLKAGRGRGARVPLEEARESGVPVEGLVVEVNKGGYVVEIGGARCFCPLGAMDIRRIEDPAAMVGRKLAFRVTELRGTRDVVLSRRVLLEEERTRQATETRGRLAVGARLTGTVTNLRDFGAFVDLGGVEGLVPASELGYGRNRPQDVLRIGQAVDVQVLAMEPGEGGRDRLTLSMKALQDDPFGAIAGQLSIGTIVAGTVTRVQPFGAFVEVASGVEGLLHVSAFGRRVAHPSDVVKPGQTIAVRVDGVDVPARRLSLHHADPAELVSPAEASDATPGALRILRRPSIEAAPREPVATPDRVAEIVRGPAARAGDVVDVVVDRVEKYGVFVSWPAGRGLVPARELGLPRGTDIRRHFDVGTAFRAVVLEVRDDGKLTLSKTAVERAEERAETDAWLGRPRASQGSGLGTLGDLLAAKLRK